MLAAAPAAHATFRGATIVRIRVKGGRRHVVRRLPSPYEEEADYHLPELACRRLLMRR